MWLCGTLTVCLSVIRMCSLWSWFSVDMLTLLYRSRSSLALIVWGLSISIRRPSAARHRCGAADWNTQQNTVTTATITATIAIVVVLTKVLLNSYCFSRISPQLLQLLVLPTPKVLLLTAFTISTFECYLLLLLPVLPEPLLLPVLLTTHTTPASSSSSSTNFSIFTVTTTINYFALLCFKCKNKQTNKN